MSRRGVYLCHISIIKNENTGVRVEGYAGSSGDAFFFLSLARPRASLRTSWTTYTVHVLPCALMFGINFAVCLTNHCNQMSNKGGKY